MYLAQEREILRFTQNDMLLALCNKVNLQGITLYEHNKTFICLFYNTLFYILLLFVTWCLCDNCTCFFNPLNNKSELI
jgi:hypothetical protein